MADIKKKEISQHIVAMAAMKAVLATEGVSQMVDTGYTLNFKKVLGTDNSLTGVRVIKQQNGYDVDVALNVKYGTPIPQTAWDIQENVKTKLQSLTGTPVVRVDVHIVGVN